MSYDPNSPEAKIGKWGEEIIKKWLERANFEVTRPDGNEKSLMDFVCVNSPTLFSFYVEAKVRKSLPYAYGQYPCYAFPTKQIEAYKAFLRQNCVSGWLVIVDPESKELLVGSLNSERSAPYMPLLEEKVRIDCKEFPFDQDTKIGNMRFYHHDQFRKIRDLSFGEIKALNKLKSTENKSNLEIYLDNIEEKLTRKENVSDFEWESLSFYRPERAQALNSVPGIISDAVLSKEEQQKTQSTPAILLAQLAEAVNVGKEKLAVKKSLTLCSARYILFAEVIVLGTFIAEATAKLKFYRSSSGTETLTLNGINSTLSSVETIGAGVSSLTAIGGYSSPNMNGAVRTIEEVATNGND